MVIFGVEKFTEVYSIKISEGLKHMLESLSHDEKRRMNEDLRVTMARAVHNSKFDPRTYLQEEQA